MIDTYFDRFPGIRNFMHETLVKVRERGYSQTLFGRKTWFPRIGSKNQNERQGSERAAINAPIQGTSADIIKRAMARMMPALHDAGLGDVRMLLQVHDELVVEVGEGERDQVVELVSSCMSGAVPLSVPLSVSTGLGSNWDSAAH